MEIVVCFFLDRFGVKQLGSIVLNQGPGGIGRQRKHWIYFPPNFQVIYNSHTLSSYDKSCIHLINFLKTKKQRLFQCERRYSLLSGLLTTDLRVLVHLIAPGGLYEPICLISSKIDFTMQSEDDHLFPTELECLSSREKMCGRWIVGH